MNAQLQPALSPLRVGRITGSRVGAVLGMNPYSTRADVLREMVREHFGAEREFTGNEATRYGELHEPDALAAYEHRYGVMTYGGGECIVHPAHEFLAVTPDGLVGDDGMVECKAPYSGTYDHWNQKPYYEAQMRLQLACTGRKWCDFVVWRPAGISVSRLESDPFWLPRVMPILTEFMVDYAKALTNPDEHLAERAIDMESSAEWRQACREYAAAKADEDAAKSRADDARKTMIELAQSSGAKNARGCGWQVIRSERAGSVSYAKALKDLAPDADLSKYTGKPTTVYTVKECK